MRRPTWRRISKLLISARLSLIVRRKICRKSKDAERKDANAARDLLKRNDNLLLTS
jgi:hypothetical protein